MWNPRNYGTLALRANSNNLNSMTKQTCRAFPILTGLGKSILKELRSMSEKVCLCEPGFRFGFYVHLYSVNQICT